MKGEYNYCYIAISFVAIWLLLNYISNKGWFKNGKEDIVSSSKKFQPSIKFLLWFAFGFLIFSFIAPWLLTRDSGLTPIPVPFTTETGVIGDTIGGLMNPFIAIAGVIVTGLAFYIQYQANKQVQDQFKLQQFESQFYEMLKFHKENVNEMSIDGYQYENKIDAIKAKGIYENIKEQKNSNSYDHARNNNIKETKTTVGRKIFYLMLKEFHATYRVVQGMVSNHFNDKEKDKDLWLGLSYHIFFSGKKIYQDQIDNGELPFGLSEDMHKKVILELEILRLCHKEGVRYLSHYLNEESLHLDFSYKPFSGHLIRFGHFYRHMYAITNFVVNENNAILTYEEKRKYLKMFRAQLSNHEIALLYYNWLAGHGDAWEETQDEADASKKPNKFFTDFRMLHNLSKYLVLETFNPEKLFSNPEFKSFLYKSGKKETDVLFELFGIKSALTEDENKKLIARL